MRITLDTIKEIIRLTKETDSITWFKSEGIPCFDCEYKQMSVIICRYERPYGTVVSFTFTDDWGTIISESEFKKENEFFNEFSKFYDYVDETSTIEI